MIKAHQFILWLIRKFFHNLVAGPCGFWDDFVDQFGGELICVWTVISLAISSGLAGIVRLWLGPDGSGTALEVGYINFGIMESLIVFAYFATLYRAFEAEQKALLIDLKKDYT